METKNMKIKSVHVFGVLFEEDTGMMHRAYWPGGWEPRVGDVIPVYVKSVGTRGRVDYATTLPPQWPDGKRKTCIFSTTFVGRKSAPDTYEEETVEFVFRNPPNVWMRIVDGVEYPHSAEDPESRHANVNDWNRGQVAHYLFGRLR